jgi:hypothetical protein
MIADVELARSGQVADLGHLLARLGVRYVVVPGSNVPALTGVQAATSLPPPTDLVAGLVTQEDLSQLPTEGGSYVFANAAWAAGDGRQPLPGAATSAIGPVPVGVGAAGEILLWLLAAYLLIRARRRGRVRPAKPSGPEPEVESRPQARAGPEAQAGPEVATEVVAGVALDVAGEALVPRTLQVAGSDHFGEQGDS